MGHPKAKKNDGSIERADVDGRIATTIVPKFADVHSPVQAAPARQERAGESLYCATAKAIIARNARQVSTAPTMRRWWTRAKGYPEFNRGQTPLKCVAAWRGRSMRCPARFFWTQREQKGSRPQKTGVRAAFAAPARKFPHGQAGRQIDRYRSFLYRRAFPEADRSGPRCEQSRVGLVIGRIARSARAGRGQHG